MEDNNLLSLKIGDVFRFNRAKNRNKIISEFKHDGEEYFVYLIMNNKSHNEFIVKEKTALCGINRIYDNLYDGIVELNGHIVRGKGGILLEDTNLISLKKK